MRIFSIKGTKLAEISEQQFPLEKEIQRMTEANLQELFELQFVKLEFELHGLRIDTQGFCDNRIQKRQKFLSSRSRNGLPQPYAQNLLDK